MEQKKTACPTNTITRDIEKFSEQTDNIYESVIIIAKRANQIATQSKQELTKKLEEFASYSDNLEEVFENREQIEMSKYYERQPKPSLLAINEFIHGRIYFRKAEGK